MSVSQSVSQSYYVYYYYYYYFFKGHQHKAAGRKTRLDIQNYSCNGNLLCYHGVVKRNRISSLQSHGKALEKEVVSRVSSVIVVIRL